MEITDLKQKPLWQMTGEEFLFLQNNSLQINQQPFKTSDKPKKVVYGMLGIAKLFNCSIATANRIKNSKKIEKAITQIGRKIIVDAELALELAGRKIKDKK